MTLRRYKRRMGTTVYAVQLALETKGFDYLKWGQQQHCKRGDWIVRNGDDTYTVDADVFPQTYERVGPVEYRKVGDVWAERAETSGEIATKEGVTEYAAGDFIVYNNRDRTDGYAMSRAKFEELYEAAE